MEHARSPGSPLVCRSKGLKKPSVQEIVAGTIVLQLRVESNLKVFHFYNLLACTRGSDGTGISHTVRCQLNLKRYRRHKSLDSKVFIYTPLLQSF